MRDLLMVMVCVTALAAPVWAGEPVPVAADTKQLSLLIVQYSAQYRAKAYPEAIESAKQALALAEETLGPDDGQVAQILNDLGHLYETQKDLGQALPLHERALRIREKVFENTGPAVVQSLHHLGDVYTAQGKHEQARDVYKRSLVILEQQLSPNDPSLLAVLEPYESALMATGESDMAESIRARIFVIRANNNALKNQLQR